MMKNITISMGACVLILSVIFCCGCIENDEGGKVKENIGPIDISNVYHTPNIPTAADNVTIFATIHNASGYKAAISMEIEGGDGLDTKAGRGELIKNNMFLYSSGDIEAFYESGDEVKYWISIRDSRGDTVFESKQYSLHIQNE